MHPLLRRGAGWLVVGWAWAAPLVAQSVLVAEYKDQPHVVRSAAGSRPYVEIDGRLVFGSGERLALRPVEEYLPVFIAVRNVRARSRSTGFGDSTARVNNQFEFYGEFTSEQPLDHVFVVLELTMAKGAQSLFLRELGHLNPREPRTLSVIARTAYALGSGRFKLHLFADGFEVFHSDQSVLLRESALNKMVAKRIAGRTDTPPELFVGTPPEYPPQLEQAKVSGRAVVRVHIQPNGTVGESAVADATDPAFGEAAIAAVREWRFLPKIKDGRPVAASVNIPLDFRPVAPP
jgi:TonB family protein